MQYLQHAQGLLLRLVDRYTGLTGDRRARLGRIVSIAAGFSGLNVITYAVGSSLFVNRVGAAGLPLSYILVGLCSSPIYVWFAKIADRQARPQLARRVVVISALLFLLLRFCLPLNSIAVYYAIYVLVYFQWTLQLDVVLPSLISDYYTSREYNHYTPWIVMAQSLGGVLGGVLVSVLAEIVGAETLLIVVLPLALVVYWRVLMLERYEQRLEVQMPPAPAIAETTQAPKPATTDPTSTDSNDAASPTNSPSNASIETRLGRFGVFARYPIVRLLAASVFLWVVLYSWAEYQYFEIYSDRFENRLDELTSFLGKFSTFNCVAQFVALFALTRTAIEQLGVRRLSLFYPLSTLLCFSGIWLSPGFISALAMNINSASIETTLNQPIHTLFYHPIPTRIVGTARALCDGFSYATGLLVAGLLLLLAQVFELPLVNMALIGVGLSVLYLLVRFQLSEEYFKTLVANLGDDELNSEDLRAGFASIPPTRVRELLQSLESGDAAQQRRILQFLPYIRRPSRGVSAIEALIPRADRSLQQAIVQCWRDCGTRDAGIPSYLRAALHADDPGIRTVALTSCIVRQDPLSEGEVERLFRHGTDETPLSVYQNLELDTLAHIAADLLPEKSPEMRDRCDRFWHDLAHPNGEASTATATRLDIALKAIQDTNNQRLRSRLESLLQTTQDTDLLRQIFSALAELAKTQPRTERVALAQMAEPYLGHPETRVRIGAIELLGGLALEECWSGVANGLTDLEFNVRLKAVAALASYGAYNLEQLEATYLHSDRPEVTEVAIAAIAAINTRQSQAVLDRYLQPSFDQIDALLSLMRSVPDPPEWQPVTLALRHQSYLIADRVLLVLSYLGDDGTKHTVKKARRGLLDARLRQRANAIEALASMNAYKSYIDPILKILEFDAPPPQGDRSAEMDQALLDRLAQSSDTWVAAAVILTCHSLGYGLPDALGQPALPERGDLVLTAIVNSLDTNQRALNRLKRTLFLKDTQLFQCLHLRDIWGIVAALDFKSVNAGDILVRKGEMGDGLYILYDGQLQARSSDDKPPLPLERGASFGGSTLIGGLGELCPVTIVASVPSQLLILARHNFSTLNELMPQLSVRVTERTSIELNW